VRALLLAPVLLLASAAFAQRTPAPTPATTFDAWVRQQQIAALPIPHGSDQQKDSPAADPRSTALVDNTAAPSLLSLAAAFVPVASNLSPAIGPATTGGGAGGGTGTATVSLFSVLAGIEHTQPLDPGFYRSGVNARRLFFTGGSASSTQAVDNTASAAAVLGVKLLLINRREIYTTANQKALASLADKFRDLSVVQNKLLRDVRDLLLKPDCPGHILSDGRPDLSQCPDVIGLLDEAHFATTLANSSPATLLAIQYRIAQSLDTEAAFRTLLNQTYDRIAKAMQLSTSYTANLRTGDGYDLHREQIIFDYGLNPRINWTVNASADTTDRKGLKKSSSGGRFATEFQGNLTQPQSSHTSHPTSSASAEKGTGRPPRNRPTPVRSRSRSPSLLASTSPSHTVRQPSCTARQIQLAGPPGTLLRPLPLPPPQIEKVGASREAGACQAHRRCRSMPLA